MKKLVFTCLIILLWTLLSANLITVLEIDGMIAGGYLTFLQREIKIAEVKGSNACIILLNTPGGLVSTTQKMNEVILNANLPIIVYVYPSGAMAASAGAFIVLAADKAAMAPVTTIGSAQPISITPEGVSDAGDKTRKFLAGQIKSLADEKNRPADVAVDFVENNLALTAQEALDVGIIDYIAVNIDDLLTQLNNVTIEKNNKVYEITTDNYTLEYKSLQQKELMQQWLSNPQTAMLFMMLGLMGLYVGFNAPGTFIPEVLGGILLILGIYGLGLFGTNIIGIILLLVGISLIAAEFFTPGFGILGIGGIISLTIGALLVPVEPLMGADWYGNFIRTIIGIGIGIGLVLLFVLQRVLYTLRHPQTEQLNLSMPEKAIVVEALAPYGMIKAKGELWKAKSVNNEPITVNQEVKVVGREESVLLVTIEPRN